MVWTNIPYKTKNYFTLYMVMLYCIISGCEKEIQIELPEAEPGLVIEGRIETDQPPYLIITKSSGYFEATDINTFLGSFVHNAKVSVKVGDNTYPLPELCINDLPPEFRPIAANFLGVSEEDLAGVNYCIYTVPLSSLSGTFLKGEVGKIYDLTIESEGKLYTASTKIPNPVPLDTSWFALDGQDTLFGFAWAKLTDPDTAGNAYRWAAQRINLDKNGNQKDDNFVHPFGSAFDDKFFNGISFEFGYDRGHRPSQEGNPEEGEKPHYFKIGDTVVIKFCSIEKPVMEFIRKYETETWNNGNPFASPSSIPTNISGGAFGLWAGYAVSYDTVYAVK